ncbi:MAG: META domain-containing protein [Treponema sp.]|nr:META domain-containing protein [Treponema sp.]
MNHYAKTAVFWPVMALILMACAGTPQFSGVQGRDWDLVEIRTGEESVQFDRGQLEEEGFDDIFTLRFDAERVNGIGAPNRFFAPYTLAEKQGITIKTIAATLMASIREPEKLKERDYFVYLQNAVKWNIAGGSLELYSKTEDGSEIVLVFMDSGKKR